MGIEVVRLRMRDSKTRGDINCVLDTECRSEAKDKQLNINIAVLFFVQFSVKY